MIQLISSLLWPWLFVSAHYFFPRAPGQPESGPGGTEYLHAEVVFQDFAEEAGGYWLFEPASPEPDSAHVVVFVPGYGGYNPMIYGKWIRHLVRKGNIVIFPRYQQNIIWPTPNKFSDNVTKALRSALEKLETPGHVKPIVSNLAFVAHSYGGVISCNLAISFRERKIPQPKVLMLCSPGTGKLSGGRLESYSDIPSEVSLLMIASNDDWVVGDEFALKVFNEATNVKQLNLLRQFGDEYGYPIIEAHHNQPYSLDEAFDGGARNYSSQKALRIATTDAVDYYGYWKIFDAMLDCDRKGENCDVAYGGTEAQLSLGKWSDGTAIKPLEFVAKAKN